MAEPTPTIERIPTCVPGLDELMGGGLMPGRSVLIKGPPGSGKTTLGMQILMQGAMDLGRSGIFLSFEQLPDQLIQDASAFGWDIQDLAQKKLLQVHFIEPREVLSQPTRQESRLLSKIADRVDETKAQLILIDSISHLPDLNTGPEARALFLNFVLCLKEFGLTPILTAERKSGRSEITDTDAYLVDTVIHLDYQSGGVGHPDRRELEFLKTRGHRHIPGSHPYEIGTGGITIYPHHYPETPKDAKANAGEALPTGIQNLDTLLDGGYTRGSSILVAGLSGTFKTTMAAHFILAACEAGDRGLWITMRETPQELESSFAGCGLDLAREREKGNLRFLKCIAGHEPIEKTFYRAEAIIREHQIRCVVIDGMTDLTAGLTDDNKIREAAIWILRRLRDLGTTVLFTQHISRVSGQNPLSEIDGADLADTIIFLGLVEIESRLEKVVSVLKHRGGASSGDLRSISCTDRGLKISEKFMGLSGVIAGTPMGQRKARIENVFQPLYFIRDFLKVAQDPGTEAGKREKILDNLGVQTEKLIGILSQYFDQPLPKNDPTDPPKDA